MITIQLGDLDILQALQTQTHPYGEYKQHHVCANPLGFYVVLPNHDIVTFAGKAVYTTTAQEAGQIIDLLLALNKKKRSSTMRVSGGSRPKSTTKKTTARSPDATSHKADRTGTHAKH